MDMKARIRIVLAMTFAFALPVGMLVGCGGGLTSTTVSIKDERAADAH
jgi:hypothetical protein